MEIVRISLLILVSSTTCLRVSALNLLDLATNDDEDCFCFHKSPLSVPVQNKLRIPVHDLERLVVFLYRDIVTNEVKIFTPNAEKQRLIPELTSDSDDTIVTVPIQAIEHLFKNSPWISPQLELNNNHVINSEITEPTNGPIETLLGNLEAISDETNPNIYNIPPDNNQLTKGNEELHNFEKLPDSSTVHDKQLTISDQNPKVKVSENKEIYLKPTSDPGLDFIEIHTSNEESIKLPNDVDDHKLVVCGESESQGAVAGPCVQKPITLELKPCGENEQDAATNTCIHKNPTILPASELITDFETTDITNVDHAQNLYTAFDKWLDEQMKQVQVKSTKTNAIHINRFKKYLADILKDNGMFLSAGKVVDHNGHFVDMANLKLRPIYIGETVDYMTVIREKVNNKFSFPSNLQYLELILVTLFDPQRILGIIPLGKVYLPTEPQKNQAIVNSQQPYYKHTTKALTTNLGTKHNLILEQVPYSHYFATKGTKQNLNPEQAPQSHYLTTNLGIQHDLNLEQAPQSHYLTTNLGTQHDLNLEQAPPSHYLSTNLGSQHDLNPEQAPQSHYLTANLGTQHDLNLEQAPQSHYLSTNYGTQHDLNLEQAPPSHYLTTNIGTQHDLNQEQAPQSHYLTTNLGTQLDLKLEPVPQSHYLTTNLGTQHGLKLEPVPQTHYLTTNLGTQHDLNLEQVPHSHYLKRLYDKNILYEPSEKKKLQKLLGQNNDILGVPHRWNQLLFKDKIDGYDFERDGHFKRLNITEESRDQKLKDVLKTLAELGVVEVPKEKGSDTDHSDKDDEDAVFRIIGGGPATSSGNPLQNKGRSGFIENTR